MQKYNLEFILDIYNTSAQTIKSSLSEFGDELEVAAVSDHVSSIARSVSVKINTEDPTLIFDICSQFGRIRAVKINEIKS